MNTRNDPSTLASSSLPRRQKPHSGMVWRRIKNTCVFLVTVLCALLAVSVLVFILGYLLWHGGTALNWAFFTQLPKPVGESGGGIANAIVGSASLILIAAAIGIPIGFLGAIYLVEYGGTKFNFLVRYAADLLNGVPSIVVGVFAYTAVVLHTHHFSAWAGGFALGLMMIPTTLRGTEEILRLVPLELREAAAALGAPHWKIIFTVVIPVAARGILTGIMLAVARIAGETAPLLFTSFGNQFWSRGLNEPTASLPVQIYTYAISPYDDWHRQAWAAGLVLLMGVLLTNIIVRTFLRPKAQTV
ncbi:MAG: phosphate ABC transporter permease PstA [Acidobacteriia bacterium]|nr:phosphate ABC transporter permease PstA [Terriglobia bacterium]